MGIDELVSDWELDEMRHEAEQGVAPDVIAFRHGLPVGSVSRRSLLGCKDTGMAWTAAEEAFVRDNYPNHPRMEWTGWKMLERPWNSIRAKAYKLGVTRKMRTWSDDETSFLRDNYPSHGKDWDGWDFLCRTWGAIKMRAHKIGVQQRYGSANEGWRESNGMFMRGKR